MKEQKGKSLAFFVTVTGLIAASIIRSETVSSQPAFSNGLMNHNISHAKKFQRAKYYTAG